MPETTDAASLWAGSGAMALTGRPGRAAVVAPAALAVAAAQAASDLCALAVRRGVAMCLDGPALLGEAAALRGGVRSGRISVGGSARLLPTRDGWIAVNLPRLDDIRAVPAWLGERLPLGPDPWTLLATRVREQAADALVARARLLGLAVAKVEAPGPPPASAIRTLARGAARVPRAEVAPLVVDLSALWAGPLCAQLLGAAGARVIKVESSARPDGTRLGAPALFDLLNGEKQSVALDLAVPAGVAALCRLLEAADIVVESARPRALRHLGIDAETLVTSRAGRVWVSITGYGRADEGIAFGDDAAAAAGLATLAGRDDDGPLFCADAVADPLAGLYAARAALETWMSGGAALLDVALRDVAAHALAAAPAPLEAPEAPVAPPRARRARRRARPIGADTDDVLATFA